MQNSKTKSLISKVAIALVVVAFIVVCALTGDLTNPVGTLWSLLPPVIAIGLALITKEVYTSLFIGILAGALIATDFNVIKTVDTLTVDGISNAISGQAGIFMFLVILGIMVALINKSGASAAFGRWASKHVRTKTGAAICTFLFGVLIFIDDYFNCLTVGAVMRPVTDKAKMSREKLAYLIDATAAPVCMIAPISSWAAAVSGYAPEGQGISLFVKAIPFNLYSLMTFVFIIASVIMKVEYGPMRKFELDAERGIRSEMVKSDEDELEENNRGRVFDLIIPIVVLICICVYALFYIGQGGDGSIGFVDALSNTNATVGLPWGGIIALVATMIYLVARRVISIKQATECIPRGFIAMVPAILILTLATSLKNMTAVLDSTAFVEGALAGVSALHNFLPAIIFVVACLISFATGTSWGTFGILIPIVIAIFDPSETIGVICMSACLAGSVCGDHCSPISDTTIMSSAGAQCNHVNHVSTQLPYAITVAAVSFVGYIIAGFTRNVYITLGASAVMIILVLFTAKTLNGKKAD